MKITLRIKSLFYGLVGFFALAACSMERDDFITDGNAKLNVLLVDAPADYEEVWIEVLSVEVLPAGKDEENGSDWVSMDFEEGEKKVDLLSLVGEKEAWIGSKEIPAGKISQIRVVLGEDNYLVKDGQEIPLTTPSAQQSGLKLQVNKELMVGVQYDFVLDFNAAQSIVSTGNSGKYLLKPVIRLIAEEAATIKGKIVTQDANPVIFGISGNDTVSTFTDINGIFQLRGLAKGVYHVHIYPNEPFSSEFLEDITTVKGEITDLGEIELELKEEGSEE